MIKIDPVKEAAFYAAPFSFSYSSLNELLTAPRLFYSKYILKEEREEKKYLKEGSLIHFLLLDQPHFDNYFLITPEKLPSDNTIRVIKHVYSKYIERDDETLTLVDFTPEILDYLKEINLHQNLKDTDTGKGNDKRIDKVIDPISEQYFEYLKKQDTRVIIDSATLELCAKRVNFLKQNEELKELLGINALVDGRTFAVYNEQELSIPAEELNLPFGIKGTIDNCTINVRTKLIRINDFKTTNKPLTGFKDSVELWNYWLQAAVYYTLVKHWLKKFLDDSWTIEFRFLVFDKHNQFYPFLVTEETMQKWLADFEDVKEKAKYHYEQKEFLLPYDYALNLVKL